MRLTATSRTFWEEGVSAIVAVYIDIWGEQRVRVRWERERQNRKSESVHIREVSLFQRFKNCRMEEAKGGKTKYQCKSR